MTALWLAICFGTFGLGLVAGQVLHYLTETRPLWQRYNTLVEHMLKMRKQGFVPQFELEQSKTPDLSEDIVEY